MDNGNRPTSSPSVGAGEVRHTVRIGIWDNKEIRVVSNAKECEDVVKQLRLHCHEYKVLGFNCTRPDYSKQKTSLLQLSSYHGLCALIRLSAIKNIPTELKELLTDENILKVGPNASHVAVKMLQYNVRTASIFDLRYLEQQYSNFSRLCAQQLNMKIAEKSSDMDNHLWKIRSPNQATTNNAAKVVLAAIELFKKFQEKSQCDVHTFIQEHCTPYLNKVYRRPRDEDIEPRNTGTALNNQNVRLIENLEDCRAIAQQLQKDCDSYAVVGFSCGYTNRTAALLQLVSHSGLCALIVLNKIRNIPDELENILSDEKILKVGVNVSHHATKMKLDYAVHVASTMDLRYLAKECQFRPDDLSCLSIAHLNIGIQANDWRLQNIDWKANKFSMEEIGYAANEVHVTIELFKLFERKLVDEKYAGDRTKFIGEICAPNLDEDFPKRKGGKISRENGMSNQSLPDQKIRIVSTAEECRTVVQELRIDCCEYNVLGFDCEWARHGSKVALLQLASHRGLCALIRLCKIKSIPIELQNLLKDKEILKVGIIPQKDAKKLKIDYRLDVTSTLDLVKLAKKCNYRANGLGSLSEEVLNVQLSHKKSGRIADQLHRKWGDETLDEVNIKYAADDAHASIEVFRKFQEKLMGGNFGDHTKDVKRFIEEHCKAYLQK